MKKKKILFIYPTSYDAQGQLMNSRSAFMPFRTLPYLAALTPGNYESVIIDESLEKKNKGDGSIFLNIAVC